MSDIQKKLVDERHKKALLDLVDLDRDQKPEMMVSHFTYVVIREAFDILKVENEELRAQVQRLQSLPIEKKVDPIK